MVNLVQSLDPKIRTTAAPGGMAKVSFAKKEKKSKLPEHDEDRILPNDMFSKMSYNLKKTKEIATTHFPRGLYGAQDYTFFEYLQTAKFPYYIGGPILAGLFYAGVKHDNMLAGSAAKKVAKHMAIGVGMYYAASMLAKGIINTVVQKTRGMDLNHPYQRMVPQSTEYTGLFKKGIEIQKVFASNEFTRWDVLYNKHKKNSAEINERYIDMAKKFNLKADTDDPDGTLRHLIKKTIIMAKAWQYALTALYVPIGIGIANQPAWDHENTNGFLNTFKNGVFKKNLTNKTRMQNIKTAINGYIITPFIDSTKQFWKGNSKASSILGKTLISSAALGTILAIGLITTKTRAKNHNVKNEKGNGVKS